MKGDFSRETFDKRKNFSRVLMQQGRVLLDADWNNQTAILLHYLRTLAADLIGPHGGPAESFKVDFSKDEKGVILTDGKGNPKDLTVSAGHYYVDGILCENGASLNEKSVSYFNQPHYQPFMQNDLPPFPFLVYLDVWERHVTYFEDESLREVALGGIDTTTRAQVVWQVKLHGLTQQEAQQGCDKLQPPTTSDALLTAATLRDDNTNDPCNIEPDARYRGAENQLYRVEIHTGNVDDFGNQNNTTPTFKWSRENGSVVFPVVSIKSGNDTTEVRLENLGRDEKLDLREGDWVELSDDADALSNRADKLLQIASIDRDESKVSLRGRQKFPIKDDPASHPLLRRWDQKIANPSKDDNADNAAEIVENEWLTLEDGIRIRFGKDRRENPEEPAKENTKPPLSRIESRYRAGDYWLIPARTATGDVEWTKDAAGKPLPLPPRGIEHHYAPLAIAINLNALPSCRCSLNSLADCSSNNPKTAPITGSAKGSGKSGNKSNDKNL